MLTRRRLLGLTGAGVTTMGVLSPDAGDRYAPLAPSPDTVAVTRLPDAGTAWPQVGRWALPGRPNHVQPLGQGRCLVGGEIEQESTTVGYVLHVGSDGGTRTHRFDGSKAAERIVDATPTEDGVLALSAVDTDAHRLIRLTRDGEIRSTTPVRRRETQLWFPRVFSLPRGDGLLLAGISVSRAAWEGVGVVRLTTDGTPQWSQVYGYGIEPNTIRAAGRKVIADVDGYTDSGVTVGVMRIDDTGIRYQRRVPNRDVYDVRWIGDQGEDVIIVGTTTETTPERGFVARLGPSGRPRWWRSLGLAGRETSLISLVRAGSAFRIHGVVQPETSDGARAYIELVISIDGEVRELNQLPEAVAGGHFGADSVFVPDYGLDPQLHQYRDRDRATSRGDG